jgi:hypothetical protein
MVNRVQSLIHRLNALSPMPADDSSEMTEERLKNYNEVVDEIGALVRDSKEGRDSRFVRPLIHSFGYGDAYESYWHVIHILERYPLDILRPALREAVQSGRRGA